MNDHQVLIDLLDEGEKTEKNSPEWIRVRTRINQYVGYRIMVNDFITIPNRVLFRLIILGYKKDGFWPSFKGCFQGIWLALKDVFSG